MTVSPALPVARPGRFTAAGLLLGVGLGGFVDGIVLHQILQWHHLLTSEGSHPATTVAGLWLLWSATHDGTPWPFRRLAGLMLAGWGAFNLVEGLVDHHLLGLHHVRTGSNELAYDLAFLGFGALLVVVGLALARPADR